MRHNVFRACPRANGAKRREARVTKSAQLFTPGKMRTQRSAKSSFCHGRFLTLCACASHHRFQKYGGHEERTLAEGFRKGENEDKNDCHKTTRDT